MTAGTEPFGMERVLQVLAADGSVDREVILSESGVEIGRAGTGIACPDDPVMADRHAHVSLTHDAIEIADSGEGSGVWLRIRARDGRLLNPGDQVWLGSQILIVRRDGENWQIRHHGPDGRHRETHSVPAGGLFIGRASDLVLDSGDTRLSRRHAQLVLEQDRLRIYDRGAHNGTYLKLSKTETLSDGDEFRLATNHFRFVARSVENHEQDPAEAPAPDAVPGVSNDGVRSAAVPGRSSELATDAADVEPGPVSVAQQEEPSRPSETGARLKHVALESEEPDVAEQQAEKVLLMLDSDEGSISLEASVGQTILEAVQEAGLPRGEPVDWECGDGGCGVCVMGVVEGADRLDSPDSTLGEMKTIQITEQVVPDPRKYRLACLARVRGTVRLRKLT